VAQNELVRLGRDGIWGEVVRLESTGRGAVVAAIEAFEDQAGLAVGDPVEPTGRPLCVELGPGLLDHIFDGLQRPLDVISTLPPPHGGLRHKLDNDTRVRSGADNTCAFVPRGVNLPSLDRERRWCFEPTGEFCVGDAIAGGDIYATVRETSLFTHRIMMPPDEPGGRITFIADRGHHYTINDVVLEVVVQGSTTRRRYTMMQTWPVRRARPVAARKQLEKPLMTGLRMHDALFPCAVGGTVALAGGGENASMVTWTLAKNVQADVGVYVGCGQRSTDLACLIADLTNISTPDPDAGREVPLLKRTVAVANAADAPLAAREASVHMGLAIAEYFRDQGCEVSLTIDSLFRWAQATGGDAWNRQQPSTPPEYDPRSAGQQQLKTQMEALYARAGLFVCEGAPAREGSITIVGITADSGRESWNVPDGVDTVEQAAMEAAQVVWVPHKTDFQALAWSGSGSPWLVDDYYRLHIADDFADMGQACKQLLLRETDLLVKARREALSEAELASVAVATMFRQDFVRQNLYAPYDCRCPLDKTAWMMRNTLLLHSLAQATLAASASSANRTKPAKTWKEIEEALSAHLYRLMCMKFEEDDYCRKFEALGEELREAFANLGCPGYLSSF
jgi:V-type H+-transporting ATPase subunit A